MYSEEGKVAINEDLDFIKFCEQVVGWSPLTKDDGFYKNPWVKYKFYENVLFQFEKFVRLINDTDTGNIYSKDIHQTGIFLHIIGTNYIIK